MWQDLRLAVEPAAALPLAALWSGAVKPVPGERIAVVVCGANLDPASLA
jgi:threonine dehydratase